MLFVLSIALLAQNPDRSNKRTTEQLMIDNEKAVWQAAKAKDVAHFNQLVAEDARMVFESGVFTRAEYLRGLPDRTITEFNLTDFTVLKPTAQTSIVIYEASRSGTYKGRPFPPATVREASVWVNRDGRWMAVLNQETAIVP